MLDYVVVTEEGRESVMTQLRSARPHWLSGHVSLHLVGLDDDMYMISTEIISKRQAYELIAQDGASMQGDGNKS